jgi:hypothetical protein
MGGGVKIVGLKIFRHQGGGSEDRPLQILTENIEKDNTVRLA